MKKYNALNKYNLAYLGVCDEFYSLYQSVKALCDNAVEEIMAENPKKLMCIRIIEKKISSELRKILDEFLNDYTYIFTDKYSRLHPNAEAMCKIQLIEFKETELLKLTAAVISFTEFLKELQVFVCNILVQRESYERPNISWEYVWETENRYVQSLADAKRRQSVKEEKIIDTKVKKLIIYRNLKMISCNKQEHTVIPDKLVVSVIGKKQSVVLPIHKCVNCDKMFIGTETLKVYEKEYGNLFIQKECEDDTSNSEYFFNGESPIHSAGYNVVEGRMSDRERKDLLITFIESKRFTYFEICKDIENAIRIFNGQVRYAKAVSKWKSDLLFISEYSKKRGISIEK